jgi:uncharacterized protein
MGRLILIVLIAVLLLWLLRRALAAGKPKAPPPEGGSAPAELVDCAHCGVNLPKAEARSAGGRHYCSEEHWRLGPRDG